MRERYDFEGVRWEDNIKMDLEEMEWGAWTGFVWLRISRQVADSCE
jgi:hypothetical protein